jgi:hypothetical protein
MRAQHAVGVIRRIVIVGSVPAGRPPLACREIGRGEEGIVSQIVWKAEFCANK